jgi:hypothetical protein
VNHRDLEIYNWLNFFALTETILLDSEYKMYSIVLLFLLGKKQQNSITNLGNRYNKFSTFFGWHFFAVLEILLGVIAN